MWTRTFFALVVVAATALSPVVGANAADACAFTLSATSKSEWKVACADGTSSTAFDPSSLLGVKIGDNTAVELKPKAASQPVEVLVPTTFARIDPLISPTITSFALQREVGVKGKPDVTIDGSAFSQMTAMKKLYLGDINITVDGTIDLPPSLNELTINHGGLVDLKIKKYTALNITKINLRYNNLRHIPLIVFALRKVDFIDLFSNSIPALRISRRKLRRLRRLIATKRILLGDVADFVATCDGEKVTVEDNGTKFVVCQVEKEDDDDVVVESESTSGGDSTTGSSQTDTSSSSTTPTTTTSAPSSASDTTPAAASSAPTPTPTNAAATASLSAMPLAALAAIIASLVH